MALLFIDQEADGLGGAARQSAGPPSAYDGSIRSGSAAERQIEQSLVQPTGALKLAPTDLRIYPQIPEQERVKVKGGNPWAYQKWQEQMMIAPDSPFPVL